MHEYKNVTKARLLSIVPGTGQFYIGIIDFSFSTIGRGFNKIEVKEATEEEKITETDYAIITGICGFSTFIYYIYQLWRLNDDVIVYNYKKSFLEPSSFRINFYKDRWALFITKNF